MEKRKIMELEQKKKYTLLNSILYGICLLVCIICIIYCLFSNNYNLLIVVSLITLTYTYLFTDEIKKLNILKKELKD